MVAVTGDRAAQSTPFCGVSDLLMLRKHLEVASGVVLLAVGFVLALPLVPGPGIPIMIAGMAVLGRHYAWPHRLHDYAKRRWSEFRRKDNKD
jgi:hypothetical protein